MIPFFESTILFSLTSNYERQLKREIFMCHKNLKLTMDDILKMSVADRRTFIQLHNAEVERENREIQKMTSKKPTR